MSIVANKLQKDDLHIKYNIINNILRKYQLYKLVRITNHIPFIQDQLNKKAKEILKNDSNIG